MRETGGGDGSGDGREEWAQIYVWGGDGEMDERLTSGQLETAEPPFMAAAERMRGAGAAIHQRRLVARRGQ